MSTQILTEHILLVTLPPEPSLDGELETMAHEIDARSHRNVIVSFARAEVMPSNILCNLIILERRLSAADRQLVLCAVPPAIEGIFRRVGLQNLFRFAEDEAAALRLLDRKAVRQE